MSGAAYVPRHRRTSTRQRRPVVRRAGAVVGLVALQLASVGSPVAPAAAETKRVASLPAISPEAAIDPVHRRFYEGTGVGEPMRVRSLDSLKVIREFTPLSVQPGSTQPALLAADTASGRALAVNYSPQDGPHLAVIDAPAGKVVTNATLKPPAAAPAGGVWSVRGVTADPRTRDVLTAWALSGPYNPASVNATLYVAQHDPATGALRWSAAVPECTNFVGKRTPVGLNAASDAVYVACTANRTFVVRYRLAGPGQAPKSTETFQVPGQLSGAGFATVSERMYLQASTAYAQGVLVFDGKHSKTIGLIPGDALGVPGVDPTTGRLYACAGIFGLLVADAGKATPVPLGDQFPRIRCASHEPPLVDPRRRQIFAYAEHENGSKTWEVVRDDVPPYVPAAEPDPDASTVDMPEKAGVTGANASGSGSAYGSQMVLVGGPTGTLENLSGGYAYQLAQIVNSFTWALSCNPPNPAVGCRAVTVPNLGYANREIWRSRIASAKLEDSGARAIGASSDRNAYVDTDLEALSNPEVAGEQPNKNGERLTWPVERLECLDYEGGNNTPTAKGEGVSLTCERGKSVEATARDAQQPPDASVPLFRVGATSADVSVRRDAKLGLVAKATAEARNIVLAGGLVRIASVGNEVISVAHGRPGTARTTQTTTVAGVTVVDSSGNPVFRCTTVDDCEADSAKMLRAMNRALGNRIKVTLPKVETRLLASPRGAQAMLVRDKWEQLEEQTLNGLPPDDQAVPGMEIHFVADNLGQSRLLLKLAGVQTESHYTIFKLPGTGNFGGDDGDDDDGDDDGDDGTVTPTKGPAATTAPGGGDGGGGDSDKPTAKGGGDNPATTIMEKIRSGIRWVFGAGDGFLLRLAAWSLLLVPAYVGIRRRAYYRRALTAVTS